MMKLWRQGQVSSSQGSGRGMGGGCGYKRTAQEFCDRAVLYLDCCVGHMNLHMIKLHSTEYEHTNTNSSVCKTNGI